MTGDDRGADLVVALDHLDRLLKPAVEAMSVLHGPPAGADPFRGLYVTAEDADRLLAGDPGAVPGARTGPGLRAVLPEHSPLARLADDLDLDDVDLDILVIAVAPELDLRYERIYGFLSDDVSRRRPTVELAQRLVCGGPAERLRSRSRFGPHAPAVRGGLIAVVPDPERPLSPLPAHLLVPDPAVVGRLLGDDELDPVAAEHCRMQRPAPVRAGTRSSEIGPSDDDPHRGHRLFLLRGRDAGARREWVGALAARRDRPVLHVDLDGPAHERPTGAAAFEQVLRLALRAALVHGAVAHLTPYDALAGPEARERLRLLARLLRTHPGTVVVAGTGEYPSLSPPPVRVEVADPPPELRRDRWRAALAGVPGPGLPSVAPEDLDRLARRYRITADEIADAVTQAVVTLRSSPSGATTLPDELAAAARDRVAPPAGGLVRRIRPVRRRADVVLPEDVLRQLDEIRAHVEGRDDVLGRWGLGDRTGTGRGVSALFTGPSGTGKTTCAEIVAGELGLDLCTVDLSAVVSKYIGETEKNLERVFAATRDGHAVLFFDEADALFGRRSEVRDAHDRYANVETAFLLQRIESFDGVAILATNLQHNIDEAFLRRLRFVVTFPVPDDRTRAAIWRRLLGDDVPVAADVDPDRLAARFRLAGGNIVNIVLAAAHLAAAEGGPVRAAHVEHGARREYAKLGRDVPA